MQRYCTELTDRLLKSLDKEYNVVDMGAVVDVITALEKTTITKEVLEITRLGKYINELRRKTNNDALAKRAKDLVRKWRDMVLPSSHTMSHPPSALPSQQQSTSHESTSQQTVNGAGMPSSPTARIVKPRSPISTRIIKPQSPSLHDIVPSMKALSPALSLNSDHSRSPNLTPIKQLPTTMTVSNCRINSTVSPILSGTNQNHSIEAVPRTHSSNKRLRKDENPLQLSPLQQHQQLCDIGSTLKDEPAIAKKPRVNGDNMNFSIISQVPGSPSSTLKDKISLEYINNSEIDVGPKKRGRKKGSKSLKQQSLPEDRVKEKLASISRNPKLKTTQELLADLQARGSTVVGGSGDDGVGTVGQSIISRRITTEPPTTEEILRSTAHLSNHGLGGSSGVGNTGGVVDQINIMKITQSNSNKRRGESRVPDVELLESKSMQPPNSTVEEILAKLPPLDLDSIRWSDDEGTATVNGDDSIDNDKNVDYVERQPRQISDRDVDRLHENCIEGLNGNFQLTDIAADRKKCDETHMALIHNPSESAKKIADLYKRRIIDDGTNRKFREWHEMLARPSYDGQILHILPYVIID